MDEASQPPEIDEGQDEEQAERNPDPPFGDVSPDRVLVAARELDFDLVIAPGVADLPRAVVDQQLGNLGATRIEPAHLPALGAADQRLRRRIGRFGQLRAEDRRGAGNLDRLAGAEAESGRRQAGPLGLSQPLGRNAAERRLIGGVGHCGTRRHAQRRERHNGHHGRQRQTHQARHVRCRPGPSARGGGYGGRVRAGLTAALISACLAFGFGGCGSEDFGEEGESGATVVLDTDAVAPGTSFKARVDNESDQQVSYGLDYRLQREADGEFSDVELPDRVVIQIALVANPGETGPPVTIELPPDADPGPLAGNPRRRPGPARR